MYMAEYNDLRRQIPTLKGKRKVWLVNLNHINQN